MVAAALSGALTVGTPLVASELCLQVHNGRARPINPRVTMRKSKCWSLQKPRVEGPDIVIGRKSKKTKASPRMQNCNCPTGVLISLRKEMSWMQSLIQGQELRDIGSQVGGLNVEVIRNPVAVEPIENINTKLSPEQSPV